jgi:DNA mismatch repair protein MutL
LLTELQKIDFAAHCPHGRPVISRMKRSDVERLFHRS